MRFLDSVRLVTSRNNVFFRLVHPPNWDSFPYDGLATSKIQIVDMASIAKLAELYRIVDTWVLECFVSCPQNCHFAEKNACDPGRWQHLIWCWQLGVGKWGIPPGMARLRYINQWILGYPILDKPTKD
jgi:hypothetical protein